MSQDLERALDGYLAASARAGDRRALGALASRWTPRLSAFAWRLMGDADGVEEAVQDAWVEILKDLPRLRDVDAFPAFAFRIVQRRCAPDPPAPVRRRLKAQAEVEPPPEVQDPDRAVDAGRIRRSMAKLPPDQHAALWLYHIQGLNVAEIAAALDVPTGTIKTRLMHARRKIAAQLQEDPMSDLDRMIEDSLREADGRSPQLDLEPGYFAQALSLFTGRTAWVHWTIMIAQALMFIGGAFCAVKFYQAGAVMEALRWGLPSVVLLVFSAIFKSTLAPKMETNRLLMEIRRVELRIERMRSEREG